MEVLLSAEFVMLQDIVTPFSVTTMLKFGSPLHSQ